ncbi:MAG: SagB/ThcOx family dehydrogenase [Desulfosarcinaceae bacterium]
MDPEQTQIHYHQTTKHHYDRYARSAGYMDWANQPNPFRLFEGVDPVQLPLSGQACTVGYEDLFSGDLEIGASLDSESLGRFLRYAMGLSAWKQAGTSRWSLRINPSSGNLHPTECYVATPDFGGHAAAVHHYSPLLHALEPRANLPIQAWQAFRDHFGGQGFLVGLTSIPWRESWKYGERAWRYCNLDVGHALAALALACRLNGWRLSGLGAVGDDQIETVLGLGVTRWVPLEAEEPDLLCWVSVTAPQGPPPSNLPGEFIQACRDLSFTGTPNRLSARTGDWPAITRANRAALKPPEPLSAPALPAQAFRYTQGVSLPATRVLSGRRSAVQFDPRRTMPGFCIRSTWSCSSTGSKVSSPASTCCSAHRNRSRACGQRFAAILHGKAQTTTSPCGCCTPRT